MSASRHAACVSLPISYDVKQLETGASEGRCRGPWVPAKWRLIQPVFFPSTPFFRSSAVQWVNHKACRFLSEQNSSTDCLGPKIQAFRGTAHIAAVRGKGQALFFQEATIRGSSRRPPEGRFSEVREIDASSRSRKPLFCELHSFGAFFLRSGAQNCAERYDFMAFASASVSAIFHFTRSPIETKPVSRSL